MGWNGESLEKKVLACLMSVVLVVGFVPTSAFAEAAEALTTEGQPVIAEVSGDTSPDAEVGAITQEDEGAEVVGDLEANDQQAEKMPAFKQERVVDGVAVSVSAEAGVFPEGATLRVERADESERQLADAAVDEARSEGRSVAASYTFDIKVLDAQGEELQPADGRSASVSFGLAEAADGNLETDVYHLAEGDATGELTAEVLDVAAEVGSKTGGEAAAVVETDGFSLYVVEFTYDNLEYVLSGDSSVALSEILQAIGLNGEVTDVAVSDESLFSASDETGEWIVTAHKPFLTDEWMRVTINDVSYQITVTDGYNEGVVDTWNDIRYNMAYTEGLGYDNREDYILKDDITAKDTDTLLILNTSMNVTLDLKGHTLSRGLENSSSREGGHIIYVGKNATLTVKNGTLTGGNNEGDAGCIYNDGTVIIENVTITGNKCTGSGGAIYNNGTLTIKSGSITGNAAGNTTSVHGGGIYNVGTLDLQGGSITNNSAGGQGGGILQHVDGTINISGAPVVSGNSASQGNNIYLRADKTMGVTDKLTDGASLYVSTGDGTGSITKGYGTYNMAQHPNMFLHADDPEKAVLQYDGEAYIGEHNDPCPDTPYISYEWNGSRLIANENMTDDNWMSWPEDTNIPGGYFVVDGNVTVNGRATLHGNTSIVLCDGCELNVKGLYIPAGCILNIYGQSGNTGKLVSKPSGGAGIGGYSGHDNGKIVIHGGTIQATGHDNCAGIGSNSGKKTGSVIIYDGTVTATGGSNGAGIGGGRNSDADLIQIFGGTITATGKNSSAGIGGGDPEDSTAYSEYIEIYGGTVTANGDDKGADIGGGEYSSATVKIYDGKVIATGGDEGGAGIGSGRDGAASDIIIAGGKVEAKTASSKAVGMGNVDSSKGTSTMTFGYTDQNREEIRITSPSYGGSVTLENDFTCEDTGEKFSKGTHADTEGMGGTLIPFEQIEVSYIDLDENEQHEACQSITNTTTKWKDDWYAVVENATVANQITVTGNVNLILSDGCKLEAKNVKVAAGSSLTIWGQSTGSGKLVATAADGSGYAGIGGADSDCGTIIVNGGTVTATGGSKLRADVSTEAFMQLSYGGAGIGGSIDHKPGTVVINRGTVTATGGSGGAGIGGGAISRGNDAQVSSGGKVEIHGGTVTARGKSGGAGIGGGYLEVFEQGLDGTGTILITGGNVNAYGSDFRLFETQDEPSVFDGGAGIGGGVRSNAGSIEITGGTIHAYGAATSPAIGTGGNYTQNPSCDCLGGSVIISGGSVTAKGGTGDAAAIGGGRRGGGVNITISGGQVNVTDGFVGIGKGKDGPQDCTTVLTWTEDSFKTLSVTSGSYSGAVTLEKDFKVKNTETTIPAGSYGDKVAQLAGKTLVPYAEETETVPAFKSSSLVLSGQIGVNFFMCLPEIEGMDYSDSYMTYSITGKGTITERADYDPSFRDRSGNSYYGFTCYVNSIQMADTITATYHYGDGQTVSLDYSIADYIAYFDGRQSEYSQATIGLIKAIADYGHYTQPFLSAQNRWTIGKDYAEMDKHYTDSFELESIRTAVQNYTLTKKIDGSKVTKATSCLNLESETALDVFLTVEAGTELTASATFNGKTFTAVRQKDGRYRIRVSGISAHQLGDAITITGTAGGDFTITVSALAYVRAMLGLEAYSGDAWNAMAALYQYHAAAMKYRGTE